VSAAAAVTACTSAGAAPAAGHSATPSTSTSTPAPPEHLKVGTLGRYVVARDWLRFTERARRGLGPRTLSTVVYRPVIPAAAAASGRLARGLFPLVVFAPGYRQCSNSYSSLLRQWASAGYVVAGVEFPRTNCHVPGPDESDMPNQPRDMAYVIGQILDLSGGSRGQFSGLVNPREIGVAGHSDGGDTVAALVANTCCLDHRVAAAVVLAGAEWAPMPGRYFARAAPPMLFVQGSADTCNPPAASERLYQADTTGPRYYLDLDGANHFTPYQGKDPPEPVVARVTTDFLDRYLAGQHDAGAAMRQDGDATGAAELTSGSAPPRSPGRPGNPADGCAGGPGSG
jgi:predicted dienelactone hydrolase